MSTAQLKRPVVLFHMTSDQFCKLPPSDEVKLELINGEVIMAARPVPNHQYFVAELISAINPWIKRRRLGRLLPDTLMKLDGDWTPAPDLVFIRTKNLHRVKNKRIEGPVDLAIEVLSPTNPELDRETKFEAYARYGIPWYWIIDLKTRMLEEYELLQDEYGTAVTVSFDRPFKPRIFRGLTIDLASLEW